MLRRFKSRPSRMKPARPGSPHHHSPIGALHRRAEYRAYQNTLGHFVFLQQKLFTAPTTVPVLHYETALIRLKNLGIHFSVRVEAVRTWRRGNAGSRSGRANSAADVAFAGFISVPYSG